MRFFLIVLIIAILLGLFFISLDSMEYHGVSSLVLAGISSFALFRVFKYLFEGIRPKKVNLPNGEDISAPIDYLFLGDVVFENESDDLED